MSFDMLRRIVALLLLAAPTAVPAAAGVHHQLQVVLHPEQHAIEVTDRLDLSGVEPAADGGYELVLHAGLALELRSGGWRLEQSPGPVTAESFGPNTTTETVAETVPLSGWRLYPEADAGAPEAGTPVVLFYQGRINHPLATMGEEYQRSFSETAGLIEERGVYLAGASFWVPDLNHQLMTFELEVSGLQPPWDVVSQGRRSRHQIGADGLRTTAWSCTTPTEEVYLVAGPWHEYHRRAGAVEVLAFLREPDPGLAERYLEATERYLQLYQSMLPAYPFASFALVENFWETGYGMPGFTLLGPRVIRFPWILTSSYPHELLHNWWGNSVYVDYDSGNWCEGLTAYLADHLFAEQRGEAEIYRRSTLKKFTDFVSDNEDLPLTEFRSRRSAASEAVGYGKSLMLFHMIRRAVGDQLFLQALSRFYDEYRYSRASFADLASALEQTAGGGWHEFLAGWTSRTGAPKIEIGELVVEQSVEADAEYPWQLTLTLNQVEIEQPYSITIPVAITVAGRSQPILAAVGACGNSPTCEVTVPCPAQPLRLDVDPYFDAMRRLDPMEVPPALSTLFGAESTLFVLPAAADEEERAAWQELATAWSRPQPPRIILDSELESLPAEPVWLLGWSNRFADTVVSRLAAQGVSRHQHGVELPADTVPSAQHSVVLVARGDDPATAIAWIGAEPVSAIAGLARKLPHYTRYSYLGFRGPEPENMAKGLWQPLDSPLVRNLSDGELVPLELPPRQALAELPEVHDAAALLRTVTELAAAEMAGRGLGSPGLERATTLVEERFQQLGLVPAGSTGYRDSWTAQGGEPAREMQLTNLVARIPGRDPELSPVLVMAHLDHLGQGWPDVRDGNQGLVHPGADDNASGVAVLLELAATLVREPARPRSLLLAVVTGEEAGRLGSKHLLAALEPGDQPYACLNLDSVGRLGDGKIFVLNADSAREWRHIFMGVGYTTGAPITIVAEPLDASDQASCLELGIPAVQLFTGPHADYHRPGDSADKIDAAGLVTVTEASHETVGYLAERREPLTVTIASKAGESAAGSSPAGHRGSAQGASLGTMPDFGYQGPGVRVQQVTPGSAAEAAGITTGDVILAVAGREVKGLRDLSQILKSCKAGDRVAVRLQRSDTELTLEAVLGAR